MKITAYSSAFMVAVNVLRSARLHSCVQVRGASSPRDEMAYIMRHSQSCAVILQDPETLDKLLPVLSSPADAASSNGSGQVMLYIAALSWQAPFLLMHAHKGTNLESDLNLAKAAAEAQAC